MNTTQDFAVALNQLRLADPQLESALQACTSTEAFVLTIAASARRHGIPLDIADFRTQVEAFVEKTLGAATSTIEDEQLAEVAGGRGQGEHMFSSPKAFFSTIWDAFATINNH